jgi:hypothetical protein
MSASRKTINVDRVKELVNNVCLMSAKEKKDIRQGSMNILETILHETGNYRGFSYLSEADVKDGQPGVRHDATGALLPYPERFENTDPTRVVYW